MTHVLRLVWRLRATMLILMLFVLLMKRVANSQ